MLTIRNLTMHPDSDVTHMSSRVPKSWPCSRLPGHRLEKEKEKL